MGYDLKKYLHVKPVTLLLIGIFLLSLFFRTFNFSERWGLGGDDTRDVMIAQEALRRGELPLIGSFSSAGPFVFGPIFYWFIMLSFVIYPFSLLSPWFMTVIVGMITVGVLFLVGKYIGGVKLGILISFLAASSVQFSYRSTSLNQHTYIGLFASLVLLFFILLWKKHKIRFAFFTGLALGVAVSLHYQSLNLLIFLPLTFLIPKTTVKERLLFLFVGLLGFLLPSLPLLFWDSQQEWANSRNILDYMLIAQHRIYVPNSWSLFLFTYLPSYWSQVVGGQNVVSLLIMFLSGGMFLFLLIRKRVSLLLFTLACIFTLLLLVNKFYKGERSEGYLLYLAPFIFLFCGLLFEKLLFFDEILSRTNVNRYLSGIVRVFGVVLLIAVLIGNITANSIIINNANNNADEVGQTVQDLVKRYPTEAFQLYDYKWINSSKSYPLALFLSHQGKLSENGHPIGLSCELYDQQCPREHPQIKRFLDAPLLDLKGHTIDVSRKSGWVPVNSGDIYDDLMKWTKGEKLHTTFSLSKYITERMPFK